MTDDLKETIKNFLVDWDNTSMDDGFGLADYDLWMTTAITLLEQSIEKNNMNDHTTNILNSCKNEIVQDDATGLYYYLNDLSKGFYTSDDLRIIANELDSLNESWYKVADKHLEKN